MSLWKPKNKILVLNIRCLRNNLFLLSLTFSLITVYSQDKSFERKSVTDTQKKLDINNKDITDTQKKLDIRKGSITDTKKLLRKTSSISNSQLTLLRNNAIKAVGSNAYSHAWNVAPNLVKMRLKYDWLKIQVEQDYTYWKGRKKREIESKKKKRVVNEKKGKKGKKTDNGLSDIRKRDYEKRFIEYEKRIDSYNSEISRLDKMIVSMKGGGAMTTKFVENSVGEQGARLTDKFGNFQLTLNKGQKVETKSSKLDVRYYVVKYNGKVYFGLKEYFLK